MIGLADKDNKTFQMLNKLEELSIVLRGVEDIKILSNQASRDENYHACKEKYRNHCPYKDTNILKVTRLIISGEIKIFTIFVTFVALIGK